MRFKRLWLKRGTVLFHGTSVDEDFDVPQGPAWFSNSEQVARYFANWHDGPNARVLTHTVTASVALPVIETDQDWRVFQQRVAITLGHDDSDYSDPNEFAECVCQAGLPGWTIPHNYPEGADILICRPDFVVAPTQAPTRLHNPARLGTGGQYEVWWTTTVDCPEKRDTGYLQVPVGTKIQDVASFNSRKSAIAHFEDILRGEYDFSSEYVSSAQVVRVMRDGTRSQTVRAWTPRYRLPDGSVRIGTPPH